MSILSLKYRIRLVSALVACLIAIAALMPPKAQAQSTNAVPYQYIAKMYSEALGRGPDPAGWQHWVTAFQQGGCTVGTLTSVANTFYTVSEFTGLYASDATFQAPVMALYRGVLNRDPGSSELSGWAAVAKSDGWANWQYTFVPGFLSAAGAELQGDLPVICNSTQPDYGFGGFGPQNNFAGTYPNNLPPQPTPVQTGSCANAYVPPGGPTDEADLQTKLNSMSPGQTLNLAQDQLIWISTPLNIPAGVTLRTCALTQGPYNGDIPYAQMARLARQAWFDPKANFAVTVDGAMEYVWVDGQRNTLGWDSGNWNNFNVMGVGDSTNISYNRISESVGNMQLGLAANNAASPCTTNAQYNLLTAYTSGGDPNPEEPSDGIDVYCEKATVANNWIVDMTDTSIIVMGMSGDPQMSQIDGNILVQAGNSGNTPLWLDQNTADIGGNVATYFYSGQTKMTMNGNLFWTSPATTMDFAIGAGSGEAYFGGPPYPPYNTSNGGVFTNNYTPSGLVMNVRAGVAASWGTYGVDVDNSNSIDANIVNFVTQNAATTGYRAANLPGGAVVLDGNATGTFPSTTTPNATYTASSGGLDYLIGCCANPSLGNNYQLADPNFATGITYKGWTVGAAQGSASDATVQYTTTGYNNGVYTNPYELVITDPNNTFFVSAYQTVYGFTPNHSFTATVEAEASANLSGGYLAVFNDANSLLCVQYVSNQPSWTPLTCSGTVPTDGTIQVQLGSGSEPAGAWVKFDNVTLTVN